jgi:hypothetical protein
MGCARHKKESTSHLIGLVSANSPYRSLKVSDCCRKPTCYEQVTKVKVCCCFSFVGFLLVLLGLRRMLFSAEFLFALLIPGRIVNLLHEPVPLAREDWLDSKPEC